MGGGGGVGWGGLKGRIRAGGWDPKALLGDDKKKLEAAHANDGAATERRDDARHWGMHRTPSVDYAICLDGKRILVLEDYDVTLHKGDIVIQLGN